MDDFKGRLTEVSDIIRFMLAGNATLTLRSVKTGTRFTYKIKRGNHEDGTPKDFWFISLLTGEDNENDFQYFGHMWITWNRLGQRNLVYTLGRKSRISSDAPSMKAWEYFIAIFHDSDTEERLASRLQQVEVWHEGRCGRCNRKLTVPESVSSGFGPECIQHI